MEKKISVVIPIYHGGSAVKPCLDSIFNLHYNNFEVIVVDDGSSDRSIEIAQDYSCKIVRLHENRGAGAARDRGVSVATGEIVAFLDADCIAPKDWLYKINKKMTPGIIGIAGKYDLPKDIDILSKLFLTIWDPISILYNRPRRLRFCIGGNCAFWKIVLAKERAKKELRYCSQIAGGEDTIMCSELNRFGIIFYDPSISVTHNKNCSFSSIFKKSAKAGYTGAMVSYVCGPALLKDPYRVYLLIMYLSSMAMLFVILLSRILLLPTLSFVIMLSIFVIIQLPMMVAAYSQLSMRFSVVLIPPAIFITNIFYLFGQLKRIFIALKELLLRAIWVIKLIVNIVDPHATSKLYFFITKECNARCGFCFNTGTPEIYKRKDDLSLDEIKKITRRAGFIPNLTITGGEPFLRKDIYEICHLFYMHCGTKIIIIATNGIRSIYITDVVEKLLVQHRDISLTILVALDDVGERHDFMKGVKTCYEQASATLHKLHVLKLRFPSLTVGINTMLTDYNVASIEHTLGYFSRSFSYDRQALNLLREPARTSREPALISVEKYFDLVQSYNRDWINKGSRLRQRFNSLFFGHCRDMVLKEFKMRKSLDTCLAGKKFFVINNAGDVFPCELLLETLGNVREEGYELLKITHGEKTHKMQIEIQTTRCYCQWPCAIVSNILLKTKFYKNFLKGMVF